MLGIGLRNGRLQDDIDPRDERPTIAAALYSITLSARDSFRLHRALFECAVDASPTNAQFVCDVGDFLALLE